MNYSVCKMCPRRSFFNQNTLIIDRFFGNIIAFWPLEGIKFWGSVSNGDLTPCTMSEKLNKRALNILKKNGEVVYPIQFNISLSAIFLQELFKSIKVPKECPYQIEHAVYSANKL